MGEVFMKGFRGSWSLPGILCLAACLPLQAADAPRNPAGAPDAPGPQVRTVVRTVVQRAMLGMAIDIREAGPGGEGVRVLNVTPGGAAEAAGLRAGDVVVSLDGKALRGEADHPAQQQLLDIVHAAKAGVGIPIEYRRDGKITKTQVVPRTVVETAADSHLPGMRMPNLPALPGVMPQNPMQSFHFETRGPGGGFGGVQLVDLTPGLGSYFGVEKGLLVVRGPQDARFKLQDGDVLLDIDGRTPSSIGHAFQILDSYYPGETAKLHIMRQKKRIEVAVTIPQPENQPLQRSMPGATPMMPPAGPNAPGLQRLDMM